MKEVLDFLNQLAENNNREWFNANKDRFLAAQAHFNAFAQRLINALSEVDSSLEMLDVKDCTYRIYRDARFSKNKAPYKNHFGAYMCRGGKKSGYAGYYFHIEAASENYVGGHILCSGLHCPEPKLIKSVREEILDNGKGFVEAMNMAENFKLDTRMSLKRVPRDYPADFEYGEYLKQKDFLITSPLCEDMVVGDEQALFDYALSELKKTAPFVKILNRAVEYAFEEM